MSRVPLESSPRAVSNKRRRPRLLRAFRFVAACAQEAGIARRAVRSQPGCSFLLSILSRKVLLARCGFATHSCAHKLLVQNSLRPADLDKKLLPPGCMQDIIQPHATVARTTVVHSRDPQLERSLRSRRTRQDTCVLGAFALTRVSWELLLCWLEDFVRHHVAQFSTRRARIGALIHDRACCPHAARSMARASSSRGTQDRAATWDICRSRLARIHRA